MAQEPMIVLTCDCCLAWDGRRCTDGVETIGVPRTKVELDACSATREIVQRVLDVIAKYGRVPEDSRPAPARRAVRAAAARATNAVAVTQPPSGLFPAPGASVATQDWTPVEFPDDLRCPADGCKGRPAENNRSYAQHLRHHPDLLPKCVLCSTPSMNMYAHYTKHHPEVTLPPLAWKTGR